MTYFINIYMKIIKLILYHILSRIIPSIDILEVHLDRLRDIRQKLKDSKYLSDSEKRTLNKTIIILYQLRKLLIVLENRK